MGDHEVTEAQIDESVARLFDRVPSTSAEYFRRAGFCEEDAQQGARLLESGYYFSFTDVATSMGIFDGHEFRRRNPDVTPERIAEAAKQAKDAGLAGGGRTVSEADFDAIDDAIFGKPGEGRR